MQRFKKAGLGLFRKLRGFFSSVGGWKQQMGAFVANNFRGFASQRVPSVFLCFIVRTGKERGVVPRFGSVEEYCRWSMNRD